MLPNLFSGLLDTLPSPPRQVLVEINRWIGILNEWFFWGCGLVVMWLLLTG